MLKKTLFVGLVLVIVIAVLIWRVVANLDELVAGLIEEAGSSALDTAVTVSGVELKLTEGSATIAGLRVANPEGWSDQPIFDLEHITVGIDIGSLGSPVIVLNNIDIGRSGVRYEMKPDGSNNMQDLLSAVEKSDAGVAEQPAEEQQPVLLTIRRLTFEGMAVDVHAEVPAESGTTEVKESTFSLPPLEMSDVGGQGATPPQLATEIGREMAGEIIGAAAREGVNQLIERQKEKLTERLKEKLFGN